jgi:hypothetical protein
MLNFVILGRFIHLNHEKASIDFTMSAFNDAGTKHNEYCGRE